MAENVYVKPITARLPEERQSKQGKAVFLNDNRTNFRQQNSMLEKMAGSPGKAIQGFGLRIGGEQDVFDNEVAGVGNLYDVNRGIAPVAGLANLGTETLYILAHGIPRLGIAEAKVAGYTPGNFVGLLLSLGYNPANHLGLIDFKSCTAGWARLNQPSFVEEVAMILWGDHQFGGSVSGVTGFSVTLTGAEAAQRDSNPALATQPLCRWQDFGIYRQINALQTYCSILYDKLDASGGVVTEEIEFDIAVEEGSQVKELNKLKAQTPQFGNEIDHVRDEIIRIMNDFRAGIFVGGSYDMALTSISGGVLERLKLTLQAQYQALPGYHHTAVGAGGVLKDEERVTIWN